MIRIKKIFSLLPLIILFLFSCKKGNDTPPNPDSGQLAFLFEQFVDSVPLHLDTLIYENAAGNHYKLTDLQYFISDIVLHRKTGGQFFIKSDDGIHYIDVRLQASKYWQPTDSIIQDEYDSITFIFGITAEKNISNRFPNPPERDMAWPDILGGGYHYMKLNMMWRNEPSVNPMPFMFHLGIGQHYSGTTPDPDSITGYIQNYFKISFPLNLMIQTDVKKEIILEMDVNKWFGPVEIFDFAQYPMMIMQDQTAMELACRNGRNAFRVRVK